MRLAGQKKGELRARKRDTAEAIIGPRRTLEMDLDKGLPVAEACRTLGLPEPTSSRGQKEDGGLRVEQANRVKGLEQEHARLKRLVADLSRDNRILKEVAAGHCSVRPDGGKRGPMP